MQSGDGSRAAALDDVAITVSTIHYGDQMHAIRLDLLQKAFSEKSYVDLSLDDAMWIIRQLSCAIESIVSTRQ